MVVEYKDRPSKLVFNSWEEYLEHIEKEGWIGNRWFLLTTFENKKKEVITEMAEGIVDCSTIQLMKQAFDEAMALDEEYDYTLDEEE